MPPAVEKVADCVELGEGPHWDVETQSLYYVDIFGKSILKHTPATKTTTKAVIGLNHVSLIVPVKGTTDKYLISIGRKLAVVTWDGVSETVSNIEDIAEVDTKSTLVHGNRLNDGKCDATGRLWAGTMGEEKVYGNIKPNMGSLFSLEADGEIKTHLTSVSISNGLAWSLDNTKFYYIDSPKRTVDQFDFDAITGTISNRTEIFSLIENKIEGFPDGQAIDADGNLWIAVFNGHKVIKIDPRRPNILLETVDIPAKQVTSVAFGGQNLDELYVTTASFTIDGVVLEPPNHGALFKVTGLDVKGLPGVRVKI